MKVPLLVAGGTHQHRSSKLSNQYTQNFWAQIQEDDSTLSPYVLDSFGGLKDFCTLSGADTDRGIFKHLGTVYTVSDQKFFSITYDGISATVTELGTISGTDQCMFAAIGTDIFIQANNKVWHWDGTTLTDLNNPDLANNISGRNILGVDSLNRQLIFTLENGQFSVSDVGDGTNVNGLNFATAEAKPDDLIRAYVFEHLLYLFGEETTEVWWNDGVGSPPFSRVEQGYIPAGLGAKHGVCHTDEYMYFITDDAQIFRVKGAETQNITAGIMTREISTYSEIDDCIAWSMNYEGQWFIVFKFIEANKTWVYPEGGEWFNWTRANTGGNTIANGHVKAFRKNLISDSGTGKIYELDKDTFTDNGESIIRIRQTAPLHGGLFGQPASTIELNSLEMVMEFGTGLTTGQGSDPEVMLRLSPDGGKTWSTELRGHIGEKGDFLREVRWDTLGTYDSVIFEIRISDPVYVCIYSMEADIDLGV